MIRLENLYKSYPNKIIAENINFQFPDGEKIGLIGDNGAGKSTLFKMICGEEEADSGQVIMPQKSLVGFLPQEPNPAPKASVVEECESGAERLANLQKTMAEALLQLEESSSPETIAAYEKAESSFRRAGGYQLTAEAHRILRGLGFDEEMLNKSPLELSGGWRMRLELAKIFIKAPDFLLLDEPTNHLDLPSLVWVENYLKKFSGTVILISHDKSLLNRLSTSIAHLDRGTLTSYPGNFDQFQRLRSEREEHKQARFDQIERRQKELSSFVERFGAKATKAKQAQSRVKMIEKLEKEKDSFASEKASSSIRFKLPSPPTSARILFECEGLAIGYGDKKLSENLSIHLEKGQKIAIIGANGIGKSTLLKTICQMIPALSGKIDIDDKTKLAYFSQDQSTQLDHNADILANIMSHSDIGEKEARQILGSFLFSGEDVFKTVRVLSGGEKNRVGLARVLSQKANLIILDEPTNHLDMNSIDALTNALSQYEGSLIFVSHNRDFIDNVATHVLAMLKDGRSFLSEGKLEDYRRMAEKAGFPDVLSFDKDAPQKQNADDSPLQSELPKDDYKTLKRRRSQLEKQIESLEKEMKDLNDKKEKLDIEKSALKPEDYEALGDLHQREEDLNASLDQAEEKWLEASEELTQVTASLEAMGRK